MKFNKMNQYWVYSYNHREYALTRVTSLTRYVLTYIKSDNLYILTRQMPFKRKKNE